MGAGLGMLRLEIIIETTKMFAVVDSEIDLKLLIATLDLHYEHDFP